MDERVLVLATGGTIASTGGDVGAVPTEGGRELLSALPVDAEVAVEQVAQVPSPDVDLETIATIARRAEEAAAAGNGVVVLHGTDTIEETAYYLDIVLDGPTVVCTGAQRRPDQLSSDGPANVADAVAVAANRTVRAAGGAYVLMNGELHAARDATKTHTWKLESFASPGKGPVGYVGPTGFEAVRELGPRTAYFRVRTVPTARVEMVKTGVGVDGTRLTRLVEEGVDGVVLEGTGLGNAPEPMTEAVGEAVGAGVPVVVTSRCHAGSVAPVYGGGGGRTLEERGAVLAGDLPAHKARLALLLALAAHDDPEAVRAAVEREGKRGGRR